MRNRVLIIKNATHEKPGLISELLDKYDINYSIVDLSKKLEFPKIKRNDLIVIMGGPDSANDRTEKVLKELDFIKLAFQEKIPLFGICLGLQLIVKSFGGEIYPNSVEEIGFRHDDKWYTIELNEEGVKDPIFTDIDINFLVFQLHGETVQITEGIKLLGTGEFCLNQVLKIGELNYGFQFHFELTEDLLKLWTNKAPELKGKDIKQILTDFRTIKDSYLKRGKQIFENYLKLTKCI
jgi:GMP synthase-like glutamine amidotransferase